MTVQTVTFGSGSINSFSTLGSGTDYVSNWTISDSVTTGEAPLTGSLGASDRIVDLISLKLIWWADANPTTSTVDFQIAFNSSGGGTGSWQSGATNANGADTTISADLRRIRTATVYYGFVKNDTGNVRFSTYTSTGNYVYVDGGTGTYPNRRLRAEIVVHSVPNAPTSVAASSQNAVALTLTWTVPTDTGSGTINGYRVLQKPNSLANTNANWSVATVSGQASLGDTGSSANTATVTGLKPGTKYDFMVSALNSVTDALLVDNTTAYSDTIAHTGTLSAVATANTTGGVFDGTNWVTPIPKVYDVDDLPNTTTYSTNSITQQVTITYPVGSTPVWLSGDTVDVTTNVTAINKTGASIVSANTTSRQIVYATTGLTNTTGNLTGNISGWATPNFSVYNGTSWVNMNFRT